ncbi:hypothetical protein M408DRAFT_81451 [Serendipita vermifera MAFF 305830]|uniref:RNase H type-1 domain-containing protein n=1 Tax=Serendipita vermifera MAFF 305830 TaxID=933852 RepID=A0A0C3A879_SERVB|nr:hypothetical protein M408DRAFT_81451 [Serendipita vermifera MAFF 305830]
MAERIELKWVPGHMDARGNEAADEAAKEAAMGDSSEKKKLPKQLRASDGIPVSVSAMRQKLTKDTSKAWTDSWTESPRYPKFCKFEKKGRGTNFEKLAGKLRRNQMSILTQLRTNHVPLNFYLHRIKRAENADCPHCPGIAEDVDHVLLNCSNYIQPRQTLQTRAGRKAASKRHLLSDKKGVKHLLEFLHGTRRFEKVFGTLWSEKDAKEREEESGEEDEEWRGEEEEAEEEE